MRATRSNADRPVLGCSWEQVENSTRSHFNSMLQETEVIKESPFKGLYFFFFCFHSDHSRATLAYVRRNSSFPIASIRKIRTSKTPTNHSKKKLMLVLWCWVLMVTVVVILDAGRNGVDAGRINAFTTRSRSNLRGTIRKIEMKYRFWCTMYHFSAFHSGTSGSSRYSNSSCSGVTCSEGGIIAGSVLGFHFAVAAVVLSIVYCHCRNKGKPWRSNQAFVHQASSKNLPQGEAQFKSGRWTSQYRQGGTLHGPHQCLLTFDD